MLPLPLCIIAPIRRDVSLGADCRPISGSQFRNKL